MRLALAEKTVAKRGVSIALACRAFGLSETCFRYSLKRDDENDGIADLLVGLAESRKAWGFGLCFLHLRNVQGHSWNDKRVRRIYCDLELNLKIKPRRRIKHDKPEELSVPDGPNVAWSMEFAARTCGSWQSGSRMAVNSPAEHVLNDFNREGLGLEVDFSLPAERVVRSLNQIIEWRGKPKSIRVDYGPEYIS